MGDWWCLIQDMIKRWMQKVGAAAAAALFDYIQSRFYYHHQVSIVESIKHIHE